MTIRCGVLGDPIDHSLSPVLHRAGYQALGLSDFSYDPIRVAAGDLAGFLASLSQEWRGLSLTMPLKRELVGLGVAELTARASRAQAANTLILGHPAVADNTDIPGAVAAIGERVVGDVRHATILGGGATATSVGLALLDLGLERLTIAVRDPARAEETVTQLHGPGLTLDVTTLAEWEATPRANDLLVSTIPAAAQTPGLVAATEGSAAIFEVIYDPWPTPLAAAAGDRPLVSGLDLLVHQAAIQFELFTGQPAPLEAMRQAGQKALDLR